MTLPTELRQEADSLQYAHALPEKPRALLHRAADALELDIAGGHAADAYLEACKQQRAAETRALAIAGFKP